ncbi:anti-sigma factor family protein [Streptomyces chromofuscus]|uniref:Zinc-finger domain-containing protein n=1 Tax=Streptomyces chromofuscus TaxID=42881 RepID=A0A7M2SZW0_STRCW|nr:hypothetical protein [Streptomyces chromofuscus]QOV41866.1 hypothetical protein IPT68_18360 [Streptomyces chromofuscus]GGS87719.1 hypothetical protein GCM10010254_04460 [Streptomyces chromofuscus]
MTSTTDTAGHPDVTEISDLTEGLLPPSRTADVRRHLDACELCADVLTSLEEIRGLLGTLPGPARMPADVAERIDAALAAEALLNATAPEAPSAPVSVETAHTDDGAHVSRETSTAADRPSGHAHTSTTGPGRKGRGRGGRRRVAVLGTVLSVGALGLASLLVSSMDDNRGTTAQERQSAAADTFSSGKLEEKVADLLTQSDKSGGTSRTPRDPGAESVPGSDGPRILTRPTVPVPECVRKGIGRDDDALATESGTYQGTSALLVVMPDTSAPSRVTAYVVDSTCVKEAPSASAEVLLEHTYRQG